jgi:hypothetical protein
MQRDNFNFLSFIREYLGFHSVDNEWTVGGQSCFLLAAPTATTAATVTTSAS